MATPRNDIAIMRPEGVSTRQRTNSLLKIASIRGDYTISGGLYVFALTRDHEHRLRGARKTLKAWIEVIMYGTASTTVDLHTIDSEQP